MAHGADKRCKDCTEEGVTTSRPAIYPGPRCTTHHRAITKARRAKAHGRRTEVLYGITAEQYWKIYDAQDRHCYVCQRAYGRAKRLSVDHDHHLCADHPPEQGCLRCIRALLCSPCNQLIGRYGVEALQRAIEVLTDPPAQKVLAPKNTLP